MTEDKRKTVVMYRILRRKGLTAEKALELAKSKIWWRVDLTFLPDVDKRFFVWRDDCE